MSGNLFGSRTNNHQAPALTSKLGCEQLGDRVVPAVLVNEVMINPPTSTDSPHEYIELRVEANTSLSDVYVAAIEGEAGANLGEIDYLKSLESYQAAYNAQFGANGAGRIIIVQSGHGFTIPSDATGALVIVDNSLALENGANSIITFTDTEDQFSTDDFLDAEQDGSLTNETWEGFVMVDGVGFSEHSGDFVYGFDLTPSGGQDPDYMVRDNSNTTAYFEDGAYSGTNQTWSAAEIDNTRDGNGNYEIDSVTFGNVITSSSVTTAGTANP